MVEKICSQNYVIDHTLDNNTPDGDDGVNDNNYNKDNHDNDDIIDGNPCNNNNDDDNDNNHNDNNVSDDGNAGNHDNDDDDDNNNNHHNDDNSGQKTMIFQAMSFEESLLVKNLSFWYLFIYIYTGPNMSFLVHCRLRLILSSYNTIIT